MTGQIMFTDKDGKTLFTTIKEMMPIQLTVSGDVGVGEYIIHYSHPREDGIKDKGKIKGVVLTKK